MIAILQINRVDVAGHTPMNNRRRQASLKNAVWLLLMSWSAVAGGAILGEPSSFVLLLIAATLMMAVMSDLIGFRADGTLSRSLARRGTVHFVLLVCYTVVLVVLMAGPVMWLARGGALPAVLAFSGACLVAVIALVRLWPAFALSFVWDDAFPRDGSGSWIWCAARRCLRFSRHLTRHPETFFSHALPASFGQLLVLGSALLLATAAQQWPLAWRIAGFTVYGVVLLPLAQLLLLNRCLKVMLADRHAVRTDRVDSHPGARAESTAEQSLIELIAARRSGCAIDSLAQAGVHSAQELARATRLACAQGDVALLRALLVAGAALQGDGADSPLTDALAAPVEDTVQAELIMTLLSNGVHAHGVDSEGATALHLAATRSGTAVAALLIDAGIELNALDNHGHTALGRACARGNWAFAEHLISAGAMPHLGPVPPLLLAADPRADDARGVLLLLGRRASVDVRGPLGRTALLIAVLAGRRQIAVALLDAGADHNAADERGTTPLMEAARAGSMDLVELLAARASDIDAQDALGRTALSIACIARHGNEKIVNRLLGLGADPGIADAAGKTPADHASATARWHLLRALDPRKAAAPDTPRDVATAPKRNADHLLDALRFSHWEVVDRYHDDARTWPDSALAGVYRELGQEHHRRARDWLFNHGLEAGSDLADGTSLVDALLADLPASAPALVDIISRGLVMNSRGIVARVLASGGDDLAVVLALATALVERGADVFGPDLQGNTALHHAVRLGSYPLVLRLCELGVDPNACNGNSCTPVQVALDAPSHAAQLMPVLIGHGARPDVRSSTGESALGMALTRGHHDLAYWLDWSGWQPPGRAVRVDDLAAAAAVGDHAAVERLLAMGVAVNGTDRRGATALLHAVGMGHDDTAALLLSRGADPLQAAASGASCLSVAVQAGQSELLRLLLRHGVDVDHRVTGGPTALMVAAALAATDAVDLLLEQGADVNAVDAHGMTALLGAACHAFGSADPDQAAALLARLLDARADIHARNGLGQDVLGLLLGAHLAPGSDCHAAALASVLAFMLSRGAPLDGADERGVSALHACAMHGLLGCARLLVRAGADTARVDTMGRTAADVASLLGYVDVAAELSVGQGRIPGARRTLRYPAMPD